jgi:hypothetical protein
VANVLLPIDEMLLRLREAGVAPKGRIGGGKLKARRRECDERDRDKSQNCGQRQRETRHRRARTGPPPHWSVALPWHRRLRARARPGWRARGRRRRRQSRRRRRGRATGAASCPSRRRRGQRAPRSHPPTKSAPAYCAVRPFRAGSRWLECTRAQRLRNFECKPTVFTFSRHFRFSSRAHHSS